MTEIFVIVKINKKYKLREKKYIAKCLIAKIIIPNKIKKILFKCIATLLDELNQLTKINQIHSHLDILQNIAMAIIQNTITNNKYSKIISTNLYISRVALNWITSSRIKRNPLIP